ncbi:hypothetical protein GCM10010191_24030 [Actinomadura vinacea]|uniref:DUF4192 domain-containing protein n=2 Tax=Actinomadura vinacea TaxID=115336 RepID=A0ABN3IUP3_9ACTN
MVIRSIPDAIAAVPYLLGYHPTDDLVVIGHDGPHNMCAIRVNLPAPDDRAELAATAERVADVLAGNRFRRALVLGYGPADRVDPAASTIGDHLTAHGLALTDAARVAAGRWWSLTCVDSGCCVPSGNPYDSSTTVVAAQATLSGKVALADRSELARSVAPLTGPARTRMRQATARAEERLRSWVSEGLTRSGFHRRMTEEGRSLLRRLHAGAGTDDDIAWLGVLLTNLRVRDEAWVRIDDDHPDHEIDFWRDVLRRVDEAYATAPACLLAYVAYVAGDGGLANVALERADPEYSMANLLGWAMETGAPPSVVRLNMTPEDLAAAHAAQDERLTDGAIGGEERLDL